MNREHFSRSARDFKGCHRKANSRGRGSPLTLPQIIPLKKFFKILKKRLAFPYPLCYYTLALSECGMRS